MILKNHALCVYTICTKLRIINDNMYINKRFIKNNLKDFADMLINMLAYRLADVESYDELDNIEKSILSEEDFNKIKIEY